MEDREWFLGPTPPPVDPAVLARLEAKVSAAIAMANEERRLQRLAAV